MERTIPKVSETDLEAINAILRKGGNVEIRKRKDSVVILEVKGKVVREIKEVPAEGQIVQV